MVSVIIPAYNCEKTIGACLKSVTSQSYGDLEVIVVDDGSADGTNRVCKAMALEDPRIKLLRQENSGVSASRNAGIRASSGEFLLYVDADDALLPEAVEHLLAAMEEDVDLVIGSHMEFRGSYSKTVSRPDRVFAPELRRQEMPLLDTMIDTPWAKLFRRGIIVEYNLCFDPTLPFGEDHIFNLHYCALAGRIKSISAPVYRYRLGGMASSVKFYEQKAAINLALLNAYGTFFDGIENIPENFLKKKIKDQFYGCVNHFLAHCSRKTAIVKIEETMEVFADYLSARHVDAVHYEEAEIQAIHRRDAAALAAFYRRKKGLRLMAKRLKIRLIKLGKR